MYIFSPGASLDFYIAFGSMALMVSTLARGADPEWGTISQLESVCVVSEKSNLSRPYKSFENILNGLNALTDQCLKNVENTGIIACCEFA